MTDLSPCPSARVLVPVEPTPAMIDRAVAFMLQVKLGGDYGWSDYARDVYGRMLGAAPASPEGGPTGHLDEPIPSSNRRAEDRRGGLLGEGDGGEDLFVPGTSSLTPVDGAP